MAHWLFKEEPSKYAFSDLEADGRTTWEGVRNNLALKHLREVKRGDRVFYYHTGKEKAVVGIMEVVKGAYPDPGQDDPRFVVVDVKPCSALARPVTLGELKAREDLQDFPLVRLPRLSVMPVTEKQWRVIERMGEQ